MATGASTSDPQQEGVRAALRRFAPRLAVHHGPAIISLEVPDLDPLSLWRLHPERDAVYWDPPSGDAVAAVGVLRRIAAGPADDPEAGDRALSRLAGDLLHLEMRGAQSAGQTGAPIRLFGGSAFDRGQDRGVWEGFGEGAFALPLWSLERTASGCVLRCGMDAPPSPSDLDGLEERITDVIARLSASRVEDEADRPSATALPAASTAGDPPEAWELAVDAARAAMREGRLEKVVLCRRAAVRFDEAPDPVSVLRSLSARGGEYVFGVRRAGRTFLGASPELLLAREGPRMVTEALAGTCRVERGRDRHGELVRAAERLFGSGKDVEEHALVVRGIVEALEPISTSRVLPAWPEVKGLRDLAHLSSRVEAEIPPEVGPLQLLRALHPTPAVGGLPRAEALGFLSTAEPVERGWYAGPVGWISVAGDAEIAVGIRSALLAGDVAWLYAGAGIVPASEPAAEYRETEDKLGRLAAVLGVAQVQA